MRFVISARRERENDRVTIELSAIFGLIRYKIDIPAIKFIDWYHGISIKQQGVNQTTNQVHNKDKLFLRKSTLLRNWRKAQQFLKATTGFNEWFKRLLARISCEELRWTSRIGLEDAAATAVMTGVIWAIKSTLTGVAVQYVRMKQQPQLAVLPQYNKLHFSTNLHISGRISFFYILFAVLSLIWRIIITKGGIRTWRKLLAGGEGTST